MKSRLAIQVVSLFRRCEDFGKLQRTALPRSVFRYLSVSSGVSGNQSSESSLNQEILQADPERLWQSVPEESASTDTGGYIKVEDIGIDPKQVDGVRKQANELFFKEHPNEVTGSSQSPESRKEAEKADQNKDMKGNRLDQPALGQIGKDALENVPSDPGQNKPKKEGDKMAKNSMLTGQAPSS